MARTAKQTDPQIQAALKRLDALAEQAPDMAEPIAFYRATLPILRDARTQVTPFTLDPETTRDKIRSGLSLLVGEDLPLDWDATRALFLKLCRTVETVGSPAPSKSSSWSLFKRGQPDTLKLIEQARNGDGARLRATAAAQIRHAVEKDALDLLAVLGALASGDWRRIELTLVGLKLDPELLKMLAQNSLKPSLRAWMQGLKDSVDVDGWQRGQCPFCGSPPVFAEIQGKEGARRLRCAMCGGDWPYPRLQCAFCSTEDYKQLGYISIEGEEEKYRLQTCEKCRGYLKVIVTFDPTPVDQLSIEDLATLHLDLIASEREFTRVAVQ